MQIFLTGSSGYIGSAVALRLLHDGATVRGLVRDASKAEALKKLGLEPVAGDLDDAELLRAEAQAADAVVNAADNDHRAAAEALVEALAGSGKPLIHSSGSSIVGDEARGEPAARIYDEAAPLAPEPARAARVEIDRLVLNAPGVRSAVLCNAMVYGDATSMPGESVLIAALAQQALSSGEARYVGRGLNRWSNVHVTDMADLYALVLREGSARSFLYVENGEEEMRAIVQAIGDRFGLGEAVNATDEQAEAAWGLGLANYALGSNSRVRGSLGKSLGWKPTRDSIADWIRESDSQVLARSVA